MKNLAYKSRDTMETDGAISSDIIGKDKGGQMNNDCVYNSMQASNKHGCSYDSLLSREVREEVRT